jgi:hypothetical protein
MYIVLELSVVCQVQAGVEQAHVTVKEGGKRVADLEYKIKNAAQIKAKELKDADAEVKKCKKAAEESQKKWESKEQEEGSLLMELGKPALTLPFLFFFFDFRLNGLCHEMNILFEGLKNQIPTYGVPGYPVPYMSVDDPKILVEKLNIVFLLAGMATRTMFYSKIFPGKPPICCRGI